LGRFLLGLFISVTVGRNSAKFQLPTSTAVLLVEVFWWWWCFGGGGVLLVVVFLAAGKSAA
jgi:hypothetical protein